MSAAEGAAQGAHGTRCARPDGGTKLALRPLVAATVCGTTGTLPVFITGAVAVQMSAELGFGITQLGVLATVFFGAAAMSSIPAGHLAERLGTYRSMALAGLLGATSLLGVALLGRAWWVLVVFLMVGGASNGLCQPSANLLIARGIAPARQGVAFGFKQAAAPGSTLIAGMMVPLVALTIGWRWAYVLAVAIPLSVLVLTPRVDDRAVARRGTPAVRDSPMRALVAIAAAAGLGTASATALGTFLVSSSVDFGMGPAAAGVLLAAGSVCAMLGRIGSGWLADRYGGSLLRGTRLMFVGGAVGFLLLAIANATWIVVTGTLLAFAFGFGWNGLLVYAVVRANPAAPAAATGVTQTGLYLGGVVGPLFFGIVSARWGFALGWLGGAAMLGLAWIAALAGERLLRRHAAATTAAAG